MRRHHRFAALALPAALAALAALGALAATAPPLALSARAASTDAGAAATPVWVPDGVEVHGSAGPGDPPRLETGRAYRDGLAKGESKYYAVRLDAASTAYLSVFAVPRPGSRVSFIDGVSLRLLSSGGALCDAYDARFGADDATAPVGGAVRRVAGADGPCHGAGTYLLVVERDSAGTSSGDVWPLDIRFMNEPGVAGAGASGAAAGGGAGSPEGFVSSPPPTVTTAPRPLSGAVAMDAAARVPGTGVYTDRLAPGVTHYFRVPVDWGQSLSVTAAFGAAHVTRAGGFTGGGVSVTVYDPARGYAGGDAASYTGTSAAVTAQTPPVRYANRWSQDPRVNGSPVAGWYYVQVGVHPQVASYTSGTVPVTLRVAVSGAPQAGPRYVSALTGTGFGVTGVAVPGAGPSGTARPRLRALGYAALGAGTVLVAGIGAWVLRARRVPG
ncbi:hypothetical protein K7472_25290 [Streptomyces sp. PTM05]|uniref:Uncharacterized protein n=1 Tax=Streptantibioticus parmotrematis TaxID=2873249 RepID=A0ABS7QY47_9ACTN|nr:hypothetical protein [Streptantibioticus parmotrematis]MBY8888128.1 hypothetical protein [Streptantibioticus parmotrematis]